MNFLKKNLIFLVSAGLMISSVSTSFATKKTADGADFTDKNPCAAQVQKANHQEASEAQEALSLCMEELSLCMEKLSLCAGEELSLCAGEELSLWMEELSLCTEVPSLRMEDVEQYRNRFIEAIENNNKKALVFFDKPQEVEVFGKKINVALKEILFSDVLLISLSFPNPEGNINAEVQSSPGNPDPDSSESFNPSTLMSILKNPFKIVFKEPGQIDDEVDYIINYLGVNVDFILEYATVLLKNRNDNFDIEDVKRFLFDNSSNKDVAKCLFDNLSNNWLDLEDIESFLCENKDKIDPLKLSPQLQFMLKALNNVVENVIAYRINNIPVFDGYMYYSKIYTKLKDSIKNQDVTFMLNGLSINNEILEIILPFIKLKQNLTVLDLSTNQLTALPESIVNLNQLEKLNLTFNKLTALPESIGKLTQLTCLNLFGNNLTALPDSIGNLNQLKSLNLYGNQLTALPDNLRKLTNLECFSTRCNFSLVGDRQVSFDSDNAGIRDWLQRNFPAPEVAE